MNQTIEFVVRSALIGAGATVVMDLWAALLRRFGVPSLDFALLGRYLGHLPKGRWLHAKIAESPPIRGELLLGLSAHYAIGITFAALLLALFGLPWARSPSPAPALVIGVATVVAPLFLLQPAFGAGVASRKTRTPVFSTVKSFVTHTVFGVGLFLAARTTAWLIPANG